MNNIDESIISKDDTCQNSDQSVPKNVVITRNTAKRRSFRHSRIESEPTRSFNNKPNHRWLYEPTVIKNEQYQDSFDEWTRSVFEKNFLKFTKYNLLLLLVSKHCFLPMTSSASTADLTFISSNLNDDSSKTLSMSNTNIRLLAQKQQEDLKLYVTKRRLSGSMSNLLHIGDVSHDMRQILPSKPGRYAIRKK